MQVSWLSAFEGPNPSLPEREVESGQQRTRLVVGLGAGADRDIHAPGVGRLVVVDLREDDVFLEAEGIVAAAIEALGMRPRKSRTRGSAIDQPVDEFVHPRLA